MCGGSWWRCFSAIWACLSRAIRWRSLLNGRIRLADSFYILSIGMMLNQLPMRAGEVARSALATRAGIPFFTAATSIIVERLLDTLYVVIVLALALTQVPDAPPAITQAATLFRHRRGRGVDCPADLRPAASTGAQYAGLLRTSAAAAQASAAAQPDGERTRRHPAAGSLAQRYRSHAVDLYRLARPRWPLFMR